MKGNIAEQTTNLEDWVPNKWLEINTFFSETQDVGMGIAAHHRCVGCGTRTRVHPKCCLSQIPANPRQVESPHRLTLTNRGANLTPTATRRPYCALRLLRQYQCPELGRAYRSMEVAEPTSKLVGAAVPPIYTIYRRNLEILHHHRIPFPACIRSSKSSRTARRSTQKSLPCDSRYLS